jgi:hypothetical protein
MPLWDEMRLLHQSLALGEQSAKEPGIWRNPGEVQGREIVLSIERSSKHITLERAAGCTDELIEAFLSRDESEGATEPGVRVVQIGATFEPTSETGSGYRRYTFTEQDKILEQEARTQRITMRRTRRTSTAG